MKKQPPSRSSGRGGPSDRSAKPKEGGRGSRGAARGAPQGKWLDTRKEGRKDNRHEGRKDNRPDNRHDNRKDARPHRREPEGEMRPRRQRGEQPSPSEAQGHQHSPRMRANLFGLHAVRAAFLNPARVIKAFYFTNLLEEDIRPLYEEADRLGLERPEPEMIEKQTMDRMFAKNTVHQNIALDAEPLEDVFLPDLINHGNTKRSSVIVLLDQVTDPHNMGAIMRSACAFGADGIIVQSRHAPDLNGVVGKTASGAMEHIPVAYETNLARAIDTLKEAGYFALALDERGEDTIGEAPVYAKTLVVMGAEGPGLRPLIRERCDVLVKLPTFGGFSSLNVSNAAAVALYAVVTRSAKI